MMRLAMTTLEEIDRGRNRSRGGSKRQHERDGDIPDEHIDERLTFLARAHAQFILYECGELDLDEAVSDLPCTCPWQS